MHLLKGLLDQISKIFPDNAFLCICCFGFSFTFILIYLYKQGVPSQNHIIMRAVKAEDGGHHGRHASVTYCDLSSYFPFHSIPPPQSFPCHLTDYFHCCQRNVCWLQRNTRVKLHNAIVVDTKLNSYSPGLYLTK